MFAAANDNSTLEGARAAQQRQFDRELLDEQKLLDGARIDLLAAHEAEKLALEKSFADKAIEETKRAEQEKLDAITRATRGIADYINSLKVGPDSALSPTARLAAAQGTYNSILSLAQGGNVDALARITQDFENFRKAAQAVYGSAGPYQNILNTGLGQLQGLPGIATSSDPILQALLGLQTKVQATTTAVQVNTTAVQADTTTTGGKLDSSNALLTAIKSLQSTSAQQLVILKDNLTVSQQGSFTTSRSVLTGDPGTFTLTEIANRASERSVDVSGTMLFLLEKIAFNTFATSFNIAEQNRIMGSGLPWRVGSYAHGGWVNGGIPGRDSVPLVAMPDEFMVRESATRALVRDYGAGIMDMINAGQLPERTNIVPFPVAAGRKTSAGDDEIVAELRALRKEVAELKRQDAKIATHHSNNANAVVRAIGEKLDKVITGGSKRIEAQIRHSSIGEQIRARTNGGR